MKHKVIKNSLIFTVVLIIILYIFTSPTTIIGECSKFNMSYIYFGDKSQYKEYVERTLNSLNVVSPNYFNLSEDGQLILTEKIDINFVKDMHEMNIKVVPFLSNHWNRELGRKALENREELVSQIVQSIKDYNLDGVNIDIENLTDTDKDNYTEFVRLLREKLPLDKEVSIAVAANPFKLKSGWHGSYDYKKLAQYCDYLMLMAYDESYFGSSPGPVASISFVEKSIISALEEVPNDKLVLGIPFYGRYWNINETKGGYGVDLVKIAELIDIYDGEVVFDEEAKSPVAKFTIGPNDTNCYVYGRLLNKGDYTIWFENDESIKYKLRLVQKYQLKGTGSWSLGQETENTWDYYKLWLNGKYFKDIEGHWAQEAIIFAENQGWMKGTDVSYFLPNSDLTRSQAAVTLIRALELKVVDNNYIFFQDVPSNYWALREIITAKKYGLFIGVEERKFAPNNPVTREQMAVILDRILNLEDKKEGVYNFTDIKESRWSYNSIVKMIDYGIFKGYTDGSFKPTEPITRAQMATLLYRISPFLENNRLNVNIAYNE